MPGMPDANQGQGQGPRPNVLWPSLQAARLLEAAVYRADAVAFRGSRDHPGPRLHPSRNLGPFSESGRGGRRAAAGPANKKQTQTANRELKLAMNNGHVEV